MPTHTDSDSLRENLRKNIITLVQKMDFSVSTKLPSENWLAAKFDVSRSTIRAVLAELETEGKILRRQGSGTYINTRAFLLGTTLYPRIEMRNIIEKNGYTPTATHFLYVRNLLVTMPLSCNAIPKILFRKSTACITQTKSPACIVSTV